MIITTAYRPPHDIVERSKRLAVEHNFRWAARRDYSISKMRALYGDPNIAVLTETGLHYYHENGTSPLFFHPSTAQIRIKRLMKGESDVLVDISGVQPGDRVLDSTAGLASDSIVFSFVAGPEGRVVALESEAVVSFLLQEGLLNYDSGLPPLNDAMRRIEVVHTDHLSYLRALPDNSMDVVYFDPMFRSPIEESSSLSPIRHIANHRPLLTEAVSEARRVAVKSVVLKEHRDSREFERLGFTRTARSHSKIAYGVIRP